MLKPGNKKTHKAYMWTYCTTSFNPTKAVVFNFSETRSDDNVREFLGHTGDKPWLGKLVTDGFSGYLATFVRGVTGVGCVALDHDTRSCLLTMAMKLATRTGLQLQPLQTATHKTPPRAAAVTRAGSR